MKWKVPPDLPSGRAVLEEQLDLMLLALLDRGAMHLSEALFANTTLRELDVTFNDIKGEGKDALLDAVDFSFAWCVSHIISSTCTLQHLTVNPCSACTRAGCC